MVWDLRASLLKKEERESARLADFEFKLRARTFRRLAESLSAEVSDVLPLIAQTDDDGALRELARRYPDRATDLYRLHDRSRAEARAQLIAEEGDPAPHRLV